MMRWIKRGLPVVIIVGLISAAAVTARTRSNSVAGTTLSPDAFFQTATLSRGDLTSTERLDGSVVFASTLNVLHRIETPALAAVLAPIVTRVATPPLPVTSFAPSRQPRAQPQSEPQSEPQSQPPKISVAITRSTVPPSSKAAIEPPLTVGRATKPDRTTQTITSIVSVNTVLQSGDVLYSVDGTPIVALDGTLPVWRSISIATKDGDDVKQLEASLVALGFDPSHQVTVNSHFDANTSAMVKAWQTSLGVTATGTVPIGSITFLPALSTVTNVSQPIGAKVGEGDPILTVAATTQHVIINVPVADRAQVSPGLVVHIVQSGSSVEGQVIQLRSAIQTGVAVVQAIVKPTKPLTQVAAGATVKVSVVLVKARDVLLAPAAALVSRLDGSYAVHVGTSQSTAHWVTVQLLGVSGATAAISAESLDATATVLVPV
jgi:peptidoglycan hydrolase-like protein with peptidoglycan-binding domain